MYGSRKLPYNFKECSSSSEKYRRRRPEIEDSGSLVSDGDPTEVGRGRG